MKTETASEKWALIGSGVYEGDRVVCDLEASDFTRDKDFEHGEKIVRAVNSYDALVEALEFFRLHGDTGEANLKAACALRLAKEGK